MTRDFSSFEYPDAAGYPDGAGFLDEGTAELIEEVEAHGASDVDRPLRGRKLRDHGAPA